MGYNYSGQNQYSATSAKMFTEMDCKRKEAIRAIEQAKQEEIEREERMVAGAEASIAQRELLEQQVDIIKEQNVLLKENYLKLKDMFDAQVNANIEAKEELKKSKWFNVAMMIISVIAMVAAIAGPVVTLIVSKGN